MIKNKSSVAIFGGGDYSNGVEPKSMGERGIILFWTVSPLLGPHPSTGYVRARKMIQLAPSRKRTWIPNGIQ